jgi:2-dehydro-3-deoxygluconokinase
LEKKYDVLCWGDAALRLTPPNFERLEQATSLEMTVGGSELSCSVGAARLGLKSGWFGKLPDNALGRKVVTLTRAHGVDMSNVSWVPNSRLGIYYVEMGASPRPSETVYDRQHCATTTVRPDDWDLTALLGSTRVLHSSGITPALGPNCRETMEVMLKLAQELGVVNSFDFNFRFRLWSAQEARSYLSRVFPYLDILSTTSDDLEMVFGLKGTPAENAAWMRDEFGIGIVAVTIREAPTVLRGSWSSIALADRLYRGKVTELELIDRVGSGDAYAAGFLYGYLVEKDIQRAVEIGDAMSFLKHSIPKDFAFFTKEEVLRYASQTITKILR